MSKSPPQPNPKVVPANCTWETEGHCECIGLQSFHVPDRPAVAPVPPPGSQGPCEWCGGSEASTGGIRMNGGRIARVCWLCRDEQGLVWDA